MTKNDLVHIGTFGKPVGLKGDIKIVTYTSNLKSYICCQFLVSEDSLTRWDLILVRELNSNAIVRIKNMETRKSVESFQGKKIFIERKNFPKTKKNEFYTMDLINCKVILIEKKVIGVVQSIENFGAGDLINVESINGNSFYVPMNKKNIISIDLQKRVIFINPIQGIID